MKIAVLQPAAGLPGGLDCQEFRAGYARSRRWIEGDGWRRLGPRNGPWSRRESGANSLSLEGSTEYPKRRKKRSPGDTKGDRHAECYQSCSNPPCLIDRGTDDKPTGQEAKGKPKDCAEERGEQERDEDHDKAPGRIVREERRPEARRHPARRAVYG